MSMVLPGCEEGLSSRAHVPHFKPQDHTQATQIRLQSTARLGAPAPPRDPSSWDSLSLSINGREDGDISELTTI